MNAYEKYNAYKEADTAYDYNAEEKKIVNPAPRYSQKAVADDFEDMFFYAERSSAPEVKTEEKTEKYEKVNEDLYPSSTTMQFLDKKNNPLEDYRDENETNLSKKFKINNKAKVLIAVYALVLLTIFALIILNTTLLKSIDRTVEAKTARVETLREENAALKDSLDYLSSDETISEKATEMGMIKR